MAAQLATRIPTPAQDFDARPAPPRRQPAPGDRNALLAPFLDLGAGIDAKRAHARTLAWYRARGTGWTRALG